MKIPPRGTSSRQVKMCTAVMLKSCFFQRDSCLALWSGWFLHFKVSFRNLSAIYCGDGRERTNEFLVLEYCLLDTLQGDVSVGTVSATPLHGNMRCRSMGELSACSWDRQTGQPGGVEPATSRLTKERFIGPKQPEKPGKSCMAAP